MIARENLQLRNIVKSAHNTRDAQSDFGKRFPRPTIPRNNLCPSMLLSRLYDGNTYRMSSANRLSTLFHAARSPEYRETPINGWYQNTSRTPETTRHFQTRDRSATRCATAGINNSLTNIQSSCVISKLSFRNH